MTKQKAFSLSPSGGVLAELLCGVIHTEAHSKFQLILYSDFKIEHKLKTSGADVFSKDRNLIVVFITLLLCRLL